ncbi:hypothetical protein HUB98_06095 [Paenibacillus barcinonensis]|uniref:Uncharacterized protein n=1 Tax=Paenibacillus barcinonensis TaxID=198119 RepID=A0A2V4W8D6_PAEBA|nr:hypothetical protein [Paenibacillus barcinonensis]PYE51583.1 hypothetical protein DFQ00_102378 [Paenibacillus barcinonensis]QKS55951.1 hypothetical protein HUB98_06095 [Paenibacillus barcinonensis]
MNTYNIIVNNEVIETVEEQGRCKNTIAHILMDRVYSLTMDLKQAVDVRIAQTGEAYYYSV